MPHHVDFSKFENVHELNIEVIGWQNPTTIEYTFQSNSFETALFWRVKGTTHTFVITLSEFNSLAGGEIELHFQQALTVFRDDRMGCIRP